MKLSINLLFVFYFTFSTLSANDYTILSFDDHPIQGTLVESNKDSFFLAIIIAGFTFSFSYIESFYDLFLLAIIGFTGGTGVIFLIWGYRLTEPSLIAPFEYFGLPIAFALGWIFFSEWPFDKLFPGILGIVGGGLIIVWREGIKSAKK